MANKFSLRLVLISLLCNTLNVNAQDTDQPATDRVSPKELAIPSAPVFDLMGVVPAQVVRTDEIRDFKVDWSFKSWKLSPNLALEAKPVWEAFYNRRDISKYQKAPFIMRKLSSFDVSLGTVETEQGDRRIGYALKLNLLRTNDPLLRKDLYNPINEKFRLEKEELAKDLKTLEERLDTTTNILLKPELREKIEATKDKLFSLNTRRQSEINDAAKVFVTENWNSATVDVAFGKIYTYQVDSAGSLSSLRLNRNTGWGMWLNGSYGIGKKILVSGLVRVAFYEEQLNFSTEDTTSGLVTESQAVAGNKLFTLGLNVRYGGPKYSFFAEFITERKSTTTAQQALDKVFEAPEGEEVIASTVKWDIVAPYSVNFGGDWRFNRNVILNYGIRCVMKKDFSIQSFIPVVAIACMMR